MVSLSEMLSSGSSLMICSVCKVECVGVERFDCGHSLCSACRKGSIVCIACKNEIFAELHPTPRFIKDLYAQLSMISVQQRSVKRVNLDEVDGGKKRKRFKYLYKKECKPPEPTPSHQSSAVNSASAPESLLTNGIDRKLDCRVHKENEVKKKKILNLVEIKTPPNESCADEKYDFDNNTYKQLFGDWKVKLSSDDLGDIIGRYKEEDNKEIEFKEEIQIKRENSLDLDFDPINGCDMPVLEREDWGEESYYAEDVHMTTLVKADEPDSHPRLEEHPPAASEIRSPPSVNVVLMRTSGNCYKVKESSSSHLPSTSYGPSTSYSGASHNHYNKSPNIHTDGSSHGSTSSFSTMDKQLTEDTTSSFKTMDKQHKEDIRFKEKPIIKSEIKNGFKKSFANFKKYFNLEEKPTDLLIKKERSSELLSDSTVVNDGRELGSVSSSSSDSNENLVETEREENSVEERSVTPTQQPKPLSHSNKEPNFYGFIATEELSSVLKLMLLKMALMSSSMCSITVGDHDIVIKRREETEPPNQAESPRNIVKEEIEPPDQAETPRNIAEEESKPPDQAEIPRNILEEESEPPDQAEIPDQSEIPRNLEEESDPLGQAETPGNIVKKEPESPNKAESSRIILKKEPESPNKAKSSRNILKEESAPPGQPESPTNIHERMSEEDEREMDKENIGEGSSGNILPDVGEASGSHPVLDAEPPLLFKEDDLCSIDELDEDLEATAACIQINGNAGFLEDDLFYNSTFSIGEEQPMNLTFTMCCLTSSEKDLVKKLADLTKSSINEEMSHKTTHFIAGRDAENRNEYLLAIAYRANIVTMEWVYSCLNEQCILPPDGYILESEDGPQRCIEPIPHLFQDFWIFFNSPRNDSLLPLFQLTKTLCYLGRGKVIVSHENWSDFLDSKAFPRFYIFLHNSQLTPDILDKCMLEDTVPVSFMWVLESIRAYCALPILPYVGADISRTQLASKYLVPDHLLHVSDITS